MQATTTSEDVTTIDVKEVEEAIDAEEVVKDDAAEVVKNEID